MTTPIQPPTPDLYAFYLKLRPIQQGSIMAFNGELVHAAWLDWIRSVSPEVAAWLHEGNKRRPFTCSSLIFPLPPQRMREAELRNTHLPLFPDKTYLIRITLLLGELFPVVYQSLMNVTAASSGQQSPFFQLGKQVFMVEEVIGEKNDTTRWTGFTSFSQMVEQAGKMRLNRVEYLDLQFSSLTTFSRGSAKNREYGSHHARLPLPHYVFPGLARRWIELAPAEYAQLVDRERIEQYSLEEGVFISDYDLRPHQVKFTTHPQPGFVGQCTYALRGPDDPTTAESPLTIRQQLFLLAQLAFYCGIGYKTAMGMGQARWV